MAKPNQTGLLRGLDEDLHVQVRSDFWGRRYEVGDRVTLMVEVETDEDLSYQGDGSDLSLRIGKPKPISEPQGAIAHLSILAIFPIYSAPRQFQFECKVAALHAPEPSVEKTPKQVIVMRRDLGMRKGKMIAQGAHASMKALLDMMGQNRDGVIWLRPKGAVRAWIEGSFTKVCVQVASEQELLEVFEAACVACLPAALITDSGLTEFNGVATNTCCAIGPAWPDEIDRITGSLKLL